MKWQSGERNAKVEVEDRIWRLKSKIEFEDWYRRWRNSWTSWCSNEDRISRLAKALKWKIYHLLFGFSAQASTLGVFKQASGLGSTNLQIFRFNFPTKRLWASLIYSKTARYRLFLAVVRCCVTTTLAAETFSLLSVYLNYKFGLGLPSFYLFFSLFKKNKRIAPVISKWVIFAHS